VISLVVTLTVPSGGAGTPAVPDHAPEVLHPDKSVKLSDATDKNGSNFVSATAKILCGVRDSINAFSPLRSVAGALFSILENCNVCLPSCTSYPHC